MTTAYPKHSHKEWTNYVPKNNKFAQMWDLTNIVLHWRKSTDTKRNALKQMIALVDADTKDHFRMTLCQILRQEPNQEIRKEAIYLLAQHFSWSEIEWSFWLHEKRQPNDVYVLIAAEAWCNSKHKDDKSLHEAVATSTLLFLKDAIR
jgi:hypothetical protein